MSTKLAWELNTGGLASDKPPDRNICYTPQGPSRVYRIEHSRPCPSWVVVPLSTTTNSGVMGSCARLRGSSSMARATQWRWFSQILDCPEAR
ncbi:hypothetical protein TNCV_3619501 [Trichonephila clavipes]|nr:hypothetical protein TNCV_3619501 [Trichonephila clavipes]